MRLSLAVGHERGLSIEPFGALDAVVLAQAGKILGHLRLRVTLQVAGGEEVRLDLVDVSVWPGVRMSTGNQEKLFEALCNVFRGDRAKDKSKTYLSRRRILVFVRLANIPILNGPDLGDLACDGVKSFRHFALPSPADS